MSKGTTRQYYRRVERHKLNRTLDPNPQVRHSYGGAILADGVDDDVEIR
jgi:hypothetical protein